MQSQGLTCKQPAGSELPQRQAALLSQQSSLSGGKLNYLPIIGNPKYYRMATGRARLDAINSPWSRSRFFEHISRVGFAAQGAKAVGSHNVDGSMPLRSMILSEIGCR